MKHIIYIPGLGDHFDPLRRFALSRWRMADTRVTFVPMTWNDRDETYQQKYERIVKAIDQAEGDEVTLVGESAGGAMALYTYSQQLDRIQRLVTVCGYNHGAGSVHPYHRRKHPAFYELMPVVDTIVDQLDADARSRVTTIYSTHDHVVTPQHTRIEGAQEIVLQTAGHFSSIAKVLLGRSI